MVNHVKSDKGEYVIAIGAPGSMKRVEIEYPALLERIAGLPRSKALPEIERAGIHSKLETASIMSARVPYSDAWGTICDEPEECGNCCGKGVDYGETCLTCGGHGKRCY